MHSSLRLPLTIILLFVLLTAGIFLFSDTNSDLLRTQANFNSTSLIGSLSRKLFNDGNNTITATIQLKDGSTQQTTTTVTIANPTISPEPKISLEPDNSVPPAENEANRTHEAALAALGPTCGNGLLDPEETCDFGDNLSNLGNCSSTCQLETEQCNFFVGPSVARPGEQLRFSSQCFTSGDLPLSIISINNKDGTPGFVTPNINPARQENTVPGTVTRNIPYNVEGGGPRGFYILKNNVPVGSLVVNMHNSLKLPETRLSGSNNWDVTLATPEYSTSANDPETYLIQLPSNIPPASIQANNSLTFFTQLATTCPATVSPDPKAQQSGISTIPYSGQRNIRLTKAHVESANTSSQICIYLQTASSPSFQLQTQAPLFERN